MVSSNFDLALELLEWIEINKEDLKFDVQNEVMTFQVELKFIRTFVMSTVNWRDDHEHISLTSVLARMKRFSESASFWPLPTLQTVIPCMKIKPEIFRPAIREAYLIWSDDLWLSSPTISSDSMKELFNSLLENLKDLVNWKEELDADLKGQIEALEDKLRFLRNFVASPAKQCIHNEKLAYVMRYLVAVANNTACLSYICWIDEIDEKAKRSINIKLSSLLNKVKPINPYMRGIYSGVTTALKLSELYSLVMHEVVKSFINLLLNDTKELQNLEASMMFPTGEYIENLFAAQFLLTSLFKNPPEGLEDGYSNDLWTLTKRIVIEAGSFLCSFYVGKIKEGMVKHQKTCFPVLIESIRLLKAELNIQIDVPKTSTLTGFPRIDELGFIDFLLVKLSEILLCKPGVIVLVIPEIETIQKDLNFLRSFLEAREEPYDDFEEYEKLKTELMTAAYEVENAIELLLVQDSPIFYHILNLLDAGQLINHVKMEVTSSKAIDSNVVVGFKDEEEQLMNRLIRGSSQLEIVSIVGMAGIGKTTLAKKVYSNPSVMYYFNIRSWCRVSQIYRKREMLLDILCDVIEPTDIIFKMDDGDIAHLLYKSLKGRRYLLVMDDIWNIEAFDEISASFPNDANGSRILFTSRLHDVALHAKFSSSLHPLDPLSDEESWKLLQEKVFPKDDCPPSLLQVGKKISNKCKGLPLALVVIAGLLARTERTQDWWEQVAENLNPHIAGDSQKQFKSISELGYRHLPDHLKSCFLYFGAFLENKEISARNLTWLWIAEGFVQNLKEQKSLEDVAEDFLRDLTDRSLIEVSQRRSNGGIKVCRLHDLLHVFCVEKAKEENFFQQVDRNVEFKKVRLSIDSTRFQFSDSTPSAPRVRTLLLFASKNRSSIETAGMPFIFQKFKLLKVLDLGCVVLGDSFPSEVTSLVHLKYFSTRGGMNSIPSSIACLLNLQTFLVKGLKGEIVLPESIWDLTRLRHLHVNDRAAFIFKSNELKDSSLLQNLETFSTPSLIFGADSEKMLRRLPNLRKLRCIFFESVNSSNMCYQLPVLDFLSQLETLKVFYHGHKMLYNSSLLKPCEFSFPSTLKKLTLSKFCLPWSAMSTIARLPNLEILKLLFKAFEGREWDVNDDEFLKLKFLKLDNLDIAIWNGYGYAFPCLERLVVQSCKQLEEIPSILGDVCTLQSIEVHWCSQSAAESVKQIQYQQKEMGNEVEVNIQ